MSSVLIHDIPSQTNNLRRRLRKILETMNDEVRSLESRLVNDDHDNPNIVVTGQYSSGKSALIKAITDGAAQVTINADIATDRSTSYQWDNVTLVDTPGVQSGIAEHDETAENALLSADLVLFTVTVSLFDDASAKHLVHVVDQLEKLPQTIIVVTKSGSTRRFRTRTSSPATARSNPTALSVSRCGRARSCGWPSALATISANRSC